MSLEFLDNGQYSFFIAGLDLSATGKLDNCKTNIHLGIYTLHAEPDAAFSQYLFWRDCIQFRH